MIEKLLPASKKHFPKKKFRGKKRYFKNLIDTANSFSPSLESDGWYDMWHYHADWKGYGNINWKFRLKHIEALCVIYQKFTSQLQNYDSPHQIWLYLNQDDAGQDAVFFHTPNPNEDNYPCQFEEVEWGLPIIENLFSELIPSLEFRAGSQMWNGSKIFFLHTPKIGASIE
ncbi:MAG: hypothetical protein GY710_18950 [Desulfobacteraceae bacterium]|nr:hypothetical protein [Desulfobacteraceae bacterium]